MNIKSPVEEQDLLNNQETSKFFALENFRDALFKEQYEICQTLLAEAKNRGVTNEEIIIVINSFVSPKKVR